MIVAVTLVAVILAAQPAKTPKKEAGTSPKGAQITDQPKATNQTDKQPQPQTPLTNSSPKADERYTHPSTDNSEIQRMIEIFTGLLVLVGFLQCVIALLQWVVYRRQAREMRRQRHEMRRQRHVMHGQWGAMQAQRETMEGQRQAMERQLGIMESQLEEMRSSTNVAINRDRGRPHIGVRSPDFYKTDPSVTFMLSSSGGTKIFVDDFRVAFIKTSEPEIVPEYAQSVQLYSDGKEIPKASYAPYESVRLKPGTQLTLEDRLNIQEGKLFLHFYGFLRYRDIFERKRRKSVHFRWSGPPSREIEDWRWEPVGGLEHNGEADET